jgi:hypothetical protein
MAFSAAPEFLLDFLLSRFTAMGARSFLTLVVRTAAIARNNTCGRPLGLARRSRPNPASPQSLSSTGI